MEKEPIWVRLPWFPMIYWNPTQFKVICSRLGEYIDADFYSEEMLRMSITRILVHMDFKKGFPPNIGIVTPKGRIVQMLDYEGFPFICHRSHHYGHMVADCPMIPRKHFMDEYVGPTTNQQLTGKEKTPLPSKGTKGPM